MDYFKINKYSSVEENILYIASNIIEILKSGNKSFGKVLEKYQYNYASNFSLNMETNVYLAMLFLYGIGKITIENDKIKLEERKIDFK